MSKSDIGNKYKKYELQEHVLEIPDTYIGSTEIDTIETYVYDHDKKRFVIKPLTICPGLYKILMKLL